MSVDGAHREKGQVKNAEPSYELVPPEGGWGFAVAFAMTVVFIIMLLPLATFGIIFGPFLASVGDETNGTAIVNGVFNTVYNFTGLAANQLLQKMSYRKVGILGAVIYWLGGFLTIFVTSQFQMIISFGVLQGLGFGLMLPSLFTSFNHYFDKRKNVVMSVAQAIMVSATIGCPALTRFLLDSYGFRGTLAVVSAVSLNCIPAMFSLQPVKWHMKKRRVSEIELSNVKHLPINGNPEENERKDVAPNVPAEAETLLQHNQVEKGSHYHQPEKGALKQPRKSLVSVGSFALSVTNIEQVGKSDEPAGVWEELVKSLDLNLFKDPVYVNVAFGLSLAVTSDMVFISILPLLMENAGLEKQYVTLIMTIFFTSDLACRILLSVLTAVASVRNRYLFLTGALLSAVFRTAFVMGNSFWWVASMTAALGFLRCLIQTPLPLVIAEAYSDRFVTAFSLYMVVCGFISMAFGPLVGLVKEVTQSYNMVVHLLTIAYLLCGIPWTIELICTRISKKSK